MKWNGMSVCTMPRFAAVLGARSHFSPSPRDVAQGFQLARRVKVVNQELLVGSLTRALWFDVKYINEPLASYLRGDKNSSWKSSSVLSLWHCRSSVLVTKCSYNDAPALSGSSHLNPSQAKDLLFFSCTLWGSWFLDWNEILFALA